VIVVGVRTERREESPLDEATRVRPFPRELVDTARYGDLIAERVYPPLQHLRVEFKPSAADAERGLVVIDVPPQAETEKLFLILKPVSEGESAPGWLVGIAARSVGRVDVRRPADIHGLINRGFTITERLDALTDEVGLLRERIDAGAFAPASETPANRLPALLEDRIAELEQTLAANNATGAYIYLAAAPKQPARVQTLTQQEGVRQVLELPPYTRYEGWNLATLDQARLVRGRRLSLTNGMRKHIDLYEDGTFLMFGTLEDFLAWHRRELPDKLNSLALIELVYNFLLVYDRIVADLDPLPEELHLAIGLRHAHPGPDRRVYLSYGRVDRFDYEADFDVRQAPEDSIDRTVDVEWPTRSRTSTSALRPTSSLASSITGSTSPTRRCRTQTPSAPRSRSSRSRSRDGAGWNDRSSHGVDPAERYSLKAQRAAPSSRVTSADPPEVLSGARLRLLVQDVVEEEQLFKAFRRV
jgi:hypothetical protein